MTVRKAIAEVVRWSAALCAVLVTLALYLSSAPAAAQTAIGSTPLDGGGELEWSLLETTPARSLAFAVPSHAIWTRTGFEEPLEIAARANYLGFIERWAITIYRATDRFRKTPLKRFTGRAGSLNGGVIWDGQIDDGARLRPGERVMVVLTVYGAGGTSDETETQDVLLTRFVMAREQKGLDAETTRRRKALTREAPPRVAQIPVAGRAVTFAANDWGGDDPLTLGGTEIGDRLEQILPHGTHRLIVAEAKPLRNGARLLPVGQAIVEIPGTSTLRVGVKGAGMATPLSSAPPRPGTGLIPVATISGQDAARLRPADAADAEGRAALRLLDPAVSHGLYEVAKGGNVLFIERAALPSFWGNPMRHRAAEPPQDVGRRAIYPATQADRLTLPHTDIAAAQVFVVVEGRPIPLMSGDYRLNARQGLFRLTAEGARKLSGLLTSRSVAAQSTVEIAYRIAAEAAATETEERAVVAILGNGDSERLTLRDRLAASLGDGRASN